MPDYSLFPATKGNQFSFDDFRTALDVGNNQPISFADLYPGGVYIPDDNNFFTFLLSVPDTGEVSINDFQKNGTSLADFTISTPDANNHVEDQTTRNLATISLNNGTFTEGQRIYYELEPSTGVADPDFTGDDVTFMTGRIGTTLSGIATPTPGTNSITLSAAFKTDTTTEGNIVLRLKIPGLDNSTPVGTNDWTPTVVSPLTDTSTNFINLDFADTTVLSSNSSITEINGWTIQKQNLRLGNNQNGPYGLWSGSGITFHNAGVNSTIAAPVDPTPFPTGQTGNPPTAFNSSGDKFGFTGTPTLDYEFKDPTDLVHNGNTQLGYSCIRLYSSGSSAGGDVAHGPLIKGKVWLPLTTSDSVRFKWRAVGGGDAYDIFAWLQEWYDPNNPSSFRQQIILNQTQGSASGDSGWQTVTAQVAYSGLYTFAFMSGTFDYTGGSVLGANLYITDIEVI
jgi:hypothetical protein